jgi:two-component system, OmpR family, KDP operon response regulator KdpE
MRMQPAAANTTLKGLPPLVGLRLVVVSFGLERAYDRARTLEEFGYRVVSCGDPHAAAEFVDQANPGAIVVDLARELASPGDIVGHVRQQSEAPTIVVGCTGTYAEMLRCFEAGADEYCRPRCPTEEIDLRMRVIFRRMQANNGFEQLTESPGIVRVGDIEIDRATQVVRKQSIPIPLSPTEFRLLATMAEHPGEVIPSKALIARVWGTQYAGETHYLRLYVRYLRQKLEDDPKHPQYIVNRWGSGYSLDAPVAARAGAVA